MQFDPHEAARLAGQLDTYDSDFDPSDVLDEAAVGQQSYEREVSISPSPLQEYDDVR